MSIGEHDTCPYCGHSNLIISKNDAAVKKLVEEHRTWAQEFGAALVMALQGDYSRVDDLAHDLIIDFPDGVPSIRSDAIKTVEGL